LLTATLLLIFQGHAEHQIPSRHVFADGTWSCTSRTGCSGPTLAEAQLIRNSDRDDGLLHGCPGGFDDTTPTLTRAPTCGWGTKKPEDRRKFTRNATCESGQTQTIEFRIRECSCKTKPDPTCTHGTSDNLGVIAAFRSEVISEQGFPCSNETNSNNETNCKPCDSVVQLMNEEFQEYLDNRRCTSSPFVEAASATNVDQANMAKTGDLGSTNAEGIYRYVGNAWVCRSRKREECSWPIAVAPSSKPGSEKEPPRRSNLGEASSQRRRRSSRRRRRSSRRRRRSSWGMVRTLQLRRRSKAFTKPTKAPTKAPTPTKAHPTIPGAEIDPTRWQSPSSHVDFLADEGNRELLRQSLEKELTKRRMRGRYAKNLRRINSETRGEATMDCHTVLEERPSDSMSKAGWKYMDLETQFGEKNIPACREDRQMKVGTTNCCPESCGPSTRYGGRPLSWDRDATKQIDDEQCSSYWQSFVPSSRKEPFCVKPIMCPAPKDMAQHEHLVRFSPCAGEAAPLCVRIKITHMNGASNINDALVLGWAEATPASVNSAHDWVKSLEEKLAAAMRVPWAYTPFGAEKIYGLRWKLASAKDTLALIEGADDTVRQALAGLRFKAGLVAMHSQASHATGTAPQQL